MIKLINRTFNAVFFAASCFILVGCATPNLASVEKDGIAKTFLPTDGKASLYIYRNELFGAAVPIPVLVNGKSLGETGARTYFKISIPAGDHTITGQAENLSIAKISTEAGKNYFVWQEIKMGMWKARNQLKQVVDSIGRAGVLESKLLLSLTSDDAFYEEKRNPNAMLENQEGMPQKIGDTVSPSSPVFSESTRAEPALHPKTTLSAHAIVIGNGAYQGSGRLDNPINDARAISAKLKGMGFKVTTVENADRTKLVSSLVKFSASAADSDLTLFFYAGHGVQISGTNYMLPTDTNLNQIGGVALHGISLNSVVEQFLPGKTKLVFLDACRDNPLLQLASRSVSRGLAPISVSQGTLISYATKDGSVAADGNGKNSPFTKALLQYIDDPDDIAVVLRKVRDQVMRDTGGQQQPWEYGSLSGGSLILSAIRAK
jgi:hypothetical protein